MSLAGFEGVLAAGCVAGFLHVFCTFMAQMDAGAATNQAKGLGENTNWCDNRCFRVMRTSSSRRFCPVSAKAPAVCPVPMRPPLWGNQAFGSCATPSLHLPSCTWACHRNANADCAGTGADTFNGRSAPRDRWPRMARSACSPTHPLGARHAELTETRFSVVGWLMCFEPSNTGAPPRAACV